MEFQAKVIQFVGETSGTSKAGNPWKKKEWVVETFGQYPRKVKIQCFGERADNMNLQMGHDYNLSVDLESREFNGRWYTDVSVFRAEEIQRQPDMSVGQPMPPSYGAAGQTFTSVSIEESDEDLPF